MTALRMVTIKKIKQEAETASSATNQAIMQAVVQKMEVKEVKRQVKEAMLNLARKHRSVIDVKVKATGLVIVLNQQRKEARPSVGNATSQVIFQTNARRPTQASAQMIKEKGLQAKKENLRNTKGKTTTKKHAASATNQVTGLVTAPQL